MSSATRARRLAAALKARRRGRALSPLRRHGCLSAPSVDRGSAGETGADLGAGQQCRQRRAPCGGRRDRGLLGSRAECEPAPPLLCRPGRPPADARTRLWLDHQSVVDRLARGRGRDARLFRRQGRGHRPDARAGSRLRFGQHPRQCDRARGGDDRSATPALVQDAGIGRRDRSAPIHQDGAARRGRGARGAVSRGRRQPHGHQAVDRPSTRGFDERRA